MFRVQSPTVKNKYKKKENKLKIVLIKMAFEAQKLGNRGGSSLLRVDGRRLCELRLPDLTK